MRKGRIFNRGKETLWRGRGWLKAQRGIVFPWAGNSPWIYHQPLLVGTDGGIKRIAPRKPGQLGACLGKELLDIFPGDCYH